MRFGVLGPLAVWQANGIPVTVPDLKVRALLAALLVNAGQPVSSGRLVEDLWGAHPPATAVNTLQTKVSRLRRVLESAEPGGRELLVSGPAGYTLDTSTVELDADGFTTLVARARATADSPERADHFARALALWRGPALADFRDEPFARSLVTKLEQERLAVQEEHAETRLTLGEHAAVSGDLGELVAEHPLRERLRAAHMRALYRAGRQSEALDSFHDLRSRLADELGLDPGPDIVALHQAILEQRPEMGPPSPRETETAAQGPSATRGGNLPSPPTELVGRDTALADVRALLRTNRLVTLSGPGGSGKSRLAVAAALATEDRDTDADPTDADGTDGTDDMRTSDGLSDATGTVRVVGAAAAPQAANAVGGSGTARGEDPATSEPRAMPFPDGAWLVELAGLAPTASGPPAVAGEHAIAPGTTAGDVADLITAVLGLRDFATRGTATGEPGAGVPDRLVAALAHHRALVILDNCEHVIEPVAELAGRLVSSAPGVRVLATSREPLGVPGEAVRPVPPLDLPTPVATDPEVLREFSAVQLFLTRARDAAPDFTLTADNAAAVASICRRLDGLPLALELAASRVRGFGANELARRLDDRFRLLSSGKRGVPARQRTLRAVLDWSWGLLSEAEHAVLRRLAVHADGCTLAAAEAVCAGNGVDPGDVPELLARLVDRSLVTAAHCAETRYGLLESVAAYCLERLEDAGEAEPVRSRHHHYYAALAEEAEPHLRGPNQREWLATLDAESANLRAALDGAVRSGDAALAQRITGALSWYWYLRGRWSEARRALARALAVPGPAPAAVTARARTWHAGMAMLDGTYRAEPNNAVLELYDHAGDAAGLAMAQWFLGHVEYLFGNLAESERLVEAALDTFRGLGDEWGTAAALSVQASHAIFRGDLPTMRRLAERSAALFTSLGEAWGRLHATGTLGTYFEITGDYARAAELYSEAQRLAADLDLASEAAMLLARCGRIALLERDYKRADELLERAREQAARQQYTHGEEFAETGLALSARRQGRLDDAEPRLRRWLEWNRRVEADYGAALILAELGFVAELRGDADAARELHLDGLDAAGATGDPRAIALAMEGLAGAETLAGHHGRAARLLGSAHATRLSAGAVLPPGERDDVDRIADRARTALGSAAFDTEFHRGAGAQSRP
ncbi:putative ATPase/DNA-binding SARP family transcriptional activator [Lipingzhangella halophila]|uniref:Putative ATPase/DNA-binding SARP family transcriptional activator n=1 Tax=Lipingzhangella halophila TaxID=1783352 RepID=A0A7W7RN37_9ACTN|nr:BTAD domain-containing putative transcriptional regulator [Lipingzhangella halophila]MBB4935001.1 putative ATPase/DNA-binding SARP family transcriptional activator [Lipingzhangella halophila]